MPTPDTRELAERLKDYAASGRLRDGWRDDVWAAVRILSASEERGEGEPAAWLREWKPFVDGEEWCPSSVFLYRPPPPSSPGVRDVPLYRAPTDTKRGS